MTAIDATTGGLITGLSVAVFAASAAILVFETAADVGFSRGLTAGVGVSSGDGLWAIVLVATTGTAVATGLGEQWPGLWKWVALAALLVLAASLVRNLLRRDRTHGYSSVAESESAARVYRSFFGHAVTDPVTIIFFISLMAGSGNRLTPAEAVAFVVGVFIGSLCWQTALAMWGSRRSAPLSATTRARLGWVDFAMLTVFTVYIALGT